MALNCDVQTLVDQAKCLQCIPPGMEMSALIAALCQIQTTGGGSGTVTSFSAGNLSPLFTTSVANATSTPALTFALDTQNANKALWGPTTGADAAPTFRAMVNADLGTGLTPQFLRLGVGAAADANMPLMIQRPSGGNVGLAVAQFECLVSEPFVIVGTAAANSGGTMYFQRSTGKFLMGVYGAANGMSVDNTGNVDAQTFSSAGTPGVASGSFTGVNTVSVQGGLIVNIA